MKITERLTYLLIILGMISLNSYIVWWHSGHYDYLNERLEIIKKNCEKNEIKIPPICNKDKCFYNSF
jgi:hypothetical protein